MTSSEVTQENALATATATVTADLGQANVDTTNRRSQQDETTNNNTSSEQDGNDSSPTVPLDQHEETTGQLQLVPPPRPESSSDRHTANQGRDMHHLAFAVDLLRDLDMLSDDDDDSDDDEDMYHLSQ